MKLRENERLCRLGARVLRRGTSIVPPKSGEKIQREYVLLRWGSRTVPIVLDEASPPSAGGESEATTVHTAEVARR